MPILYFYCKNCKINFSIISDDGKHTGKCPFCHQNHITKISKKHLMKCMKIGSYDIK